MSMSDAERMITVAELLRREGFQQSAASRKRQKIAVAATGAVALAGATVTGMLVLAPNLSTSFSTEDGQLPVSSGNGGSAATPSTSDARKAGPPPATFASITTMAAVRETADAPEPPVRIPAMSQLDRGAPPRDNDRASASERSAEPAPTQASARRPAEDSEKARPRDKERQGARSAEATESQGARHPAEDETQQSETEQPPSEQEQPEREKQAAGDDEGKGKGSDKGAEKSSEKGSDKGSDAGNGKGR